MLDQKTLEWLEERSGRKSYFCVYCSEYSPNFPCNEQSYIFNDCPVSDGNDYEDAAKFEALVQINIIRNYERDITHTYSTQTRSPLIRSREEVLRQARIAAENDMEELHNARP